MKSVDVSEFREQADALFGADAPFTVKRNGQANGTYIPFRRADKAAAARSADKLSATLEAIYAQTGMSEDEFVAAFLAAGDEYQTK